jgi:DNA invertase Pin-like site-specific DNA recombinase
MLIGYTRVSTRDQDTALQEDAPAQGGRGAHLRREGIRREA